MPCKIGCKFILDVKPGPIVQAQVFEFLEGLRNSGAINMLGAVSWIELEFGLTYSEGRRLLAQWMSARGQPQPKR